MGLREEMIQVAAVAVAVVQDLDGGTTKIDYFGHLTHWLDEVQRERMNQEKKWGPQHHTPEEWMAILAEEVGEAGNEVWRDSIGEDLSSYAEFSLAEAMFNLELFARAFLKERFGDDPSD